MNSVYQFFYFLGQGVLLLVGIFIVLVVYKKLTRGKKVVQKDRLADGP